jgi:hypothetical protein
MLAAYRAAPRSLHIGVPRAQIRPGTPSVRCFRSSDRPISRRVAKAARVGLGPMRAQNVRPGTISAAQTDRRRRIARHLDMLGAQFRAGP